MMIAIAATYVPSNSPFWRVRLETQNGPDWNDCIMPAEVTGLLLTMDARTHAHPSRP